MTLVLTIVISVIVSSLTSGVIVVLEGLWNRHREEKRQ